MKKISIIVSIYNVENYLEKCIKSLLNQDIDDYEIILVNDGSKDNSVNICNKFVDKYDNIRLLNKENGGLSSARNYGLNKAKGKYVFFVDADDYIEDNCLGKIYSILEENELDILQINYREVIDNEKSNNKINYSDENNIITGKEWIKTRKIIPMIWTYIYNREFLLNNQLIFKEGIYHEDAEFTPRALMAANRTMFKDICVYFYIIRNGSIMRSKNIKKSLDLIVIGKEIKKIKDSVNENELLKALEARESYMYGASISGCIKQGYKIQTLFKDKNEKKYISKILLNSSRLKYKITGLMIKLNIYKLIDLFYKRYNY